MQQISLAHLNLVAQAVVRNILLCHAHCHTVNINSFYRLSAQHCRSNRQNAAAGTNVKHSRIRRNNLLQTLHHHIGSVMRACAESHTRIDFNNMLAFLRSILLPARLNNKALAHMSNMEILLPFVSPILLTHLAEASIAETVLADALLNQRQLLVNLCQAFFQLLIISIISADSNNLGILLLRDIAQLPGTAVAQIINQLRILNRNSLRTDARQHIRYGLYCFMRYRYINFYPLHCMHSFENYSLYYYTLSRQEMYTIT